MKPKVLNFVFELHYKDGAVERDQKFGVNYSTARDYAQELLDAVDTLVSVDIIDSDDYWETWKRNGNLYNACVDSGRR